MDQSKQALRDYCGDGNGTCASSLREITLIETVTSFLEEHGASEIDRKVLRKLAEALSKSIDENDWDNVLIKDKFLNILELQLKTYITG